MSEATGSMAESTATLGQRLRAEREKRGLSTQKAADELRLDGWVVDALEGGDYVRIGPAVYVRGHLKRYAALLGLSAAEILAAYDTGSERPGSGSQSPNLRMGAASSAGRDTPWAQALGFAVVAVILAAVVWLKPWYVTANGPGAASPPHSAAAAGPPASPEAAVDARAAAEDAAPAGSAVATPELAPLPVPMATAATAPEAATSAPSTVRSGGVKFGTAAAGGGAAGTGHARLRLSFSADAWVDVHDATGQRVYFGNGRANSVKTLSGEAPLRVYLKSVGGVQLQINDLAVAIGPQFVSGDTARFEAGADGVLRRETRPPAGAAGDAAARGAPAGAGGTGVAAPADRPRG